MIYGRPASRDAMMGHEPGGEETGKQGQSLADCRVEGEHDQCSFAGRSLVLVACIALFSVRMRGKPAGFFYLYFDDTLISAQLTGFFANFGDR